MFVDRRIGAAVEVCGNAGKPVRSAKQAFAATPCNVFAGGRHRRWPLGVKIVGEQLLLALES